MSKKRSYFITNYRKAWNDYRKTNDYARVNEGLKDYGIRQPYRNNIIQDTFAAGWRATEQEYNNYINQKL